MTRTRRAAMFLVLAGLAAWVSYAAAAAPSRPRSVAAPTVSGRAVVGRALSASHGRWSRHPTRYSFRWLSCDSRGGACHLVRGATSRRHRIRAGEAGHRLRVWVTAHRGRARASRRSAATPVVRRADTAVAPPAPAGAPAPSGPVDQAGAGPAAGPGADPGPGASTPGAGLRVAGNKLYDGDRQVLFHGVNVSGTEFACVQGYGIFDEPAPVVAAIRSWGSNVVRVLLNETCWLGINGVDARYSGANYRDAIKGFVDDIHAHGMYAEISLMWAAPGTYQATYQPEAPNADHSPEMWRQMAQTFKDDPKVVLAPWGEPTVNAGCLLDGGCQANYESSQYTTAGMQQAVDVFRANGYHGPIAIPGIDYANNLTQWLSHEPTDPDHQLMAEAHLYGRNACDTITCLNQEYAPVAARVPLILGEFGEDYDPPSSNCATTNTVAFMDWADAHDVGYEAWTWNTWPSCLALITDADGTPKQPYGTAIRAHYAARP